MYGIVHEEKKGSAVQLFHAEGGVELCVTSWLKEVHVCFEEVTIFVRGR